jgi:dynein heavy chain
LLVGESGTGKSVIMIDCLNNLAEPGKFLTREVPGSLVPFTITFSARSSSPRTQEMLELRFEKKRKGVMGAPVNKKLVCFIDDCNMPAREEYGAQPPIELLRQVIDTLEHYRKIGGLYDRKKFDYFLIQDMVVVSACGPPGGGRNFVTARYYRHFSMLTVDAPSRSVLGVIFSSVLDGHLTVFPAEIKALVKTTVDSSIDIYEKISSEMLPTPAKSHYTFNLRDLSKVFQGILSLKVNNCPDVRTFLRVWCHENQRVFQDRLIDTEDKDQFQRWVRSFSFESVTSCYTFCLYSAPAPVACVCLLMSGEVGSCTRCSSVGSCWIGTTKRLLSRARFCSETICAWVLQAMIAFTNPCQIPSSLPS